MFRAAHCSSSGAPNCICSLWFICPLIFGNGRSPYGRINQSLQIQFGAPDDEWCAARNMLSLKLWNNKFYYKAASCWYFYWPVASLFAQNFALPWYFFHIHFPVNKFVDINIRNIVTRTLESLKKPSACVGSVHSNESSSWMAQCWSEKMCGAWSLYLILIKTPSL
jgi:hypothetical protein